MMKYCPNCAEPIIKDAKFCKRCGTNLYEYIKTIKPPQEEESESSYSETKIPKKKSKMRYGILGMIIVIIVIFLVLYLGFQGQEGSPSSSITDSDGDGISDDDDFYDNGNAEIYIDLYSFSGDTSADFWSYPDPYFIIWIDLNNDLTIDNGEYSTSPIYQDTEYVSNPHNFSLDIPDDTTSIRISISAYDSDTDDDDIFDINPSIDLASYLIDYNLSSDGNNIEFDIDGSIDGDSTLDGNLMGKYGYRKIE